MTIIDLNKPKVFVREAELYERMTKLLDEYAGDLSVVAALGVLELAKDYIKHQSHQPLNSGFFHCVR
jgi:hypothetical protein